MSIFEVCVDNIESVYNAFNGGADRLELCSALSEGGLTPSLGFLKAAQKVVGQNFPIFPMIRPRGGNFVYTNDEIDVMEDDIKYLKAEGANGFVFGLLTTTNAIDVKNCKRLIEIAKPLPVTFHRAFDEIKPLKDMLKAVDDIIELGFSRLLTSGGCKNAEEGIDTIKQVVDHSRGRLAIMPGAGISPGNLQKILTETRVMEFHGSCSKKEILEELTVASLNIVKIMNSIRCMYFS